MADRARTTRLALFGGVYAKHLAREATLADIAARGIPQAWCLGDLAGCGPHPEESIARLRAAGIPVVQGNVDRSLGHALDDCACGYCDPRDAAFMQVSYDYSLARIEEPSRAWLRSLPAVARITVAGRRVLLCHGSPRRQNEFLWESTSPDAFLGWLCDTYDANVIACSHTGIHWARTLADGRCVVNCGAMGRPANDGRPHTWYAELLLGSGVEVRFHPVAYDHEALAREMEGERLPAEFVETIRTGWWTSCLGNMPAKERMVAERARVLVAR